MSASVRYLTLTRGLCLLCLIVSATAFPSTQSDELATKSRRAKQAMAEGQFQDAVALYSELTRAVPNNPGLMMNLGLALHSAGEYRRAAHQFRAVLKLQPQLGAAWLMLGVAYQKLGNPAQALEPLRQAVKIEPKNEIALLELADACLSTGHADEAQRHFETLTELDRDNPKAWQGLGLSYAALSRQYFAELEKRSPESAYGYALLARSRLNQHQYRSAFYLYRQALAANPNLREIHAGLAEVYRKTNHPDWADIEDEKERKLPLPNCAAASLECDFLAARYRQILMSTAGVKTSETLYWQARSCGELAAEALARLARLPQSPEIYELAAVAYRIEGLHGRSIQEWQRALKLAPGDRRLEKELARSYWLNGDFSTALPLLEKLLAADLESADLNHELGDTLLQLQKLDQALAYLEAAVRRTPRFLPARASLGRAYFRLGRASDAIVHLKAALPLDQDGSLRYQLARAYEAAGEKTMGKQAMTEYETFLRSAGARKQRMEESYQITPP